MQEIVKQKNVNDRGSSRGVTCLLQQILSDAVEKLRKVTRKKIYIWIKKCNFFLYEVPRKHFKAQMAFFSSGEIIKKTLYRVKFNQIW